MKSQRKTERDRAKLRAHRQRLVRATEVEAEETVDEVDLHVARAERGYDE